MTQISFKQEIKAVKLLRKGKAVNDVAEAVGISVRTVKEIQKNGGTRAVTLHRNKYRRLRTPKWCDKCNAMINAEPCILCDLLRNQTADNDEKILTPDGLKDISMEMYLICKDIIEIKRRHLINNILFYSLASRAKETLEKVEQHE